MLHQALLDELSFVLCQFTIVQPVATFKFPDVVEDFPPVTQGEFWKLSNDLFLTHTCIFTRILPRVSSNSAGKQIQVTQNTIYLQAKDVPAPPYSYAPISMVSTVCRRSPQAGCTYSYLGFNEYPLAAPGSAPASIAGDPAARW